MGFVNRALAAILALALVVVGALTLIEIGALVIGTGPLVVPHDRWLRDLSTQAWGERSTRLTGSALVAAGVVLIVLQLLRQRPAEVPAAADGPIAARVGRHDLEREVDGDLRQVTGVAEAKAKLRRRGLDVQATLVAGDPAALRDQLEQAARNSLAARGVDPSGPVKVDVRRQPARDS